MIFRESCPYQPRRSRPKGFVNCHGRATPRRPRYAHGPGLVRRKLGGGGGGGSSSNHNDARRIWRVARAAGRADRPNRMLVLGWGAAVWLDAMRCDAVATKRTHWTGCARGRVRANVHANVCPPALRRPLARCLFSSGCGPRPRPRGRGRLRGAGVLQYYAQPIFKLYCICPLAPSASGVLQPSSRQTNKPSRDAWTP
jgi:hypothetical protein